ncbi:recombinase family protein [Devosia sp. RR2S18]|uniref:recombinase family protein n=1 Tax=Devosia rhizosphaerae TaxID=3049774 RepID=UPI002541A6BC|nr:recombinase family protein [Devosia sp. RR2S18]WIJ25823.1 recombinase family protein [Devosia sp. RR2S18]
MAAYLRVSTMRQADGDVSLPSQQHQIEAFCQARGWTVTQSFVDAGVSGTNPSRAELIEAFSRTVRDKLYNGDAALRRNYLRSVVARVIVGDKRVAIVGSTHSLHRSISEGSFSANGVHRHL